MIPKKLHYCNYGGYESELTSFCMQTWQVHAGDFELVRWDENNLVPSPIVLEAYNHGFYAFVADWMRFHILLEHGGVYLDYDVELVNSLSAFLHLKAFLGIETQDKRSIMLGSAIIGSEPGASFLSRALAVFEEYVERTGKFNIFTPRTLTEVLKPYGLANEDTVQEVDGVTIFPRDVFFPVSFRVLRNPKFKRDVHDYVTEDTFAIHRYAASWFNNPPDKKPDDS